AAHVHPRRSPAAALARLADLGPFGATIPQQAGGLGLDGAAYALIAEELGRGSATAAALLANHLDAAEMILHLGTAEQHERLLPALASRKLRGGILRRLGEPETSELNAVRHVNGYLITDGALLAA